LNGVRDTVALVQADGKAAGDGHFELTTGKAKAAQKGLERFEKAWDVAKAAWTALEAAEEAVLQFMSAHDGSEKELLKLEVAVEKAAHRAESARDSTAGAVATLVEVGVVFAEALQTSHGRDVPLGDLRAAQQSSKATFRQLSSTWVRTRQLQEAWSKASSMHRRAAKKASAAAASSVKADALLEAVEADHQKALEAQQHESSARLACEQAALEAEGQRSAAEVEDAGQKWRRSECQAQISAARAKLKPAKYAEKEASAGRAALLNHYSKADKVQIKAELEASTTSVKEALDAVRALRAEEYDKNQVEEAYQAKKKQRSEANTD